VWREMKSRGAALLRDGVYLLPERDNARAAFDLLAAAVGEGGGSAHVVQAQAEGRQQRDWRMLFDRADAYAGLLDQCQRVMGRFKALRPDERRRRLKALDEELAAIVAVDYFPGPAQARFVWLQRPAERPARAVGFDFDGAEFSHADGRVTFEVLAASFDLGADVALERLGAIVHVLDAGGGIPVPEARGFEAMMRGLRRLHAADDDFFAAATVALDAYYAAFASGDLAELRPEGAGRARRSALPPAPPRSAA